MGNAEYFILIGGNESGPWTLGEVQAFWRVGAVTLETLYAQPGAVEWKPLSAILDVAPPAAPTPLLREISNADEQRKIIDTVVNVMLPGDKSAVDPEADATVDEPAEPEEIDLPKARQWLRDTLVGLGFNPAKEAAERERFDEWLTGFSGDEQTALFGAENLKHYRREDWTWQDLISGFENSPATAIEITQGKADELTPENALWIMEIVWSIEQISEALIRDAELTAAESKRAGNDVRETENNKRLDATLSKFSDKEMASVVGKAKVEAYRAGEISAQQLLTRRGHLLTLEEFKAAVVDFRAIDTTAAEPILADRATEEEAKKKLQVQTQPIDGTNKSADMVIEISLKSVVESLARDIEAGVFDDDQKHEDYLLKHDKFMLELEYGKAATNAFLRGDIDGRELMKHERRRFSPITIASIKSQVTTIVEPKQPNEMHLTKLRVWLLDNLTALGLKPRSKPAIDANNFSGCLEKLSEFEQDEIFGLEKMEALRAEKLTSRELLDELESAATCIATGSGDDLLNLAYQLFDDEERIAPEKAPRAIAIIEHAIKSSAGNARLISEANSMFAISYAATGQTDKAASCKSQYWQHHILHATAHGNAWEIMSIARELRDKAGKLTPDVAAQIIDLAEAVLPLTRGFGMLCEAFDLLVETHSKIGNTEAAQTCQQRFLEAVKTAIEKGIPVESNQRSNAYGRAADLCEQTGRPDEATDFRKQQLEYGDGFGLLDTALAKLKTCGKNIDDETGTRLLDFLTKAVERIPAEFPERHAVAYRATGEILEVLGDKPHAVEYYEYALQKNPKVGVKKRLDALKKELGKS